MHKQTIGKISALQAVQVARIAVSSFQILVIIVCVILIDMVSLLQRVSIKGGTTDKISIDASFIPVVYGAGEGRNSEAIAIVGTDLYVITKRWQGDQDNLMWKGKINSDSINLNLICEVPVFDGSEWAQVTAMDIQGDQMIYRTYREITQVPFNPQALGDDQSTAEESTLPADDLEPKACSSQNGRGYGETFSCEDGRYICAKNNQDYTEVCRVSTSEE